MTRARDAATNSHVATFVHPTTAGNKHVPAAGATGQLLQYASAGTAAWATVSSGTPEVVFPSNWASPTNTYTSSGTWSKGSLSDDAYVWIYILSSGMGGGSRGGDGDSNGGAGGSPLLVYGKASVFNGGTYVVAATKAGNSAGNNQHTTANVSSFTLTSANGSNVFQPPVAGDNTNSRVYTVTKKTLNSVDLASHADFTQTSSVPDPYVWSDLGLPSGVTYKYFAPQKIHNGSTSILHCIFGGGNGAAYYNGTKPHGTSEFAGVGGATAAQGVAGTYPGGGGGGSQSASNSGGAGAAGIIRVYHV